MSETCETCRYGHFVWRKGDEYTQAIEYSAPSQQKRSHDFVQCRMKPPTVVGDYQNGIDSIWPSVQPTDWCGEHRKASHD